MVQQEVYLKGHIDLYDAALHCTYQDFWKKFLFIILDYIIYK